MIYPDSYYQAIQNCRMRDSKREYLKMKKMGKKAWWEENGKKSCHYRRFLGEGNFARLIEDFKRLGEGSEHS